MAQHLPMRGSEWMTWALWWTHQAIVDLLTIRVTQTQIVNLITEVATMWMKVRRVYSGEAVQKNDSCPEWHKAELMRFHHATQNGAQVKFWIVYFCNFLFNIFRLDWPQVTDITEGKPANNWWPLYKMRITNNHWEPEEARKDPPLQLLEVASSCWPHTFSLLNWKNFLLFSVFCCLHLWQFVKRIHSFKELWELINYTCHTHKVLKRVSNI